LAALADMKLVRHTASRETWVRSRVTRILGVGDVLRSLPVYYRPLETEVSDGRLVVRPSISIHSSFTRWTVGSGTETSCERVRDQLQRGFLIWLSLWMDLLYLVPS
jgi:hypothetical protein